MLCHQSSTRMSIYLVLPLLNVKKMVESTHITMKIPNFETAGYSIKLSVYIYELWIFIFTKQPVTKPSISKWSFLKIWLANIFGLNLIISTNPAFESWHRNTSLWRPRTEASSIHPQREVFRGCFCTCDVAWKQNKQSPSLSPVWYRVSKVNRGNAHQQKASE